MEGSRKVTLMQHCQTRIEQIQEESINKEKSVSEEGLLIHNQLRYYQTAQMYLRDGDRYLLSRIKYQLLSSTKHSSYQEWMMDSHFDRELQEVYLEIIESEKRLKEQLKQEVLGDLNHVMQEVETFPLEKIYCFQSGVLEQFHLASQKD